METEVARRDPVVWVTNFAGHEYSPAGKYGEFRYLTKGYISFASLDRLKFSIAQELIESQENDYLLLSGAIITCVFAASVWMSMHGKVRMLNWDKRGNNGEGEYREVTVSKTNIEQLIQVLQNE